MLDFAVRHRLAIDNITGEKTANLRKYEMEDDEWHITLQLRDTLKVHCYAHPFLEISSHPLSDIQRCNALLLAFNSQPCDCHPRHGPH
jgi:hypothetical protein